MNKMHMNIVVLKDTMSITSYPGSLHCSFNIESPIEFEIKKVLISRGIFFSTFENKTPSYDSILKISSQESYRFSNYAKIKSVGVKLAENFLLDFTTFFDTVSLYKEICCNLCIANTDTKERYSHERVPALIEKHKDSSYAIKNIGELLEILRFIGE